MSNRNPLGYAKGTNHKDFYSIEKLGYDTDIIDGIEDPEGGERTKMPTAVPSPFARFDLVQTAFKNIIGNSQLTADVSKPFKSSKFDERIVSHTLDLAEYIFNSKSRSGELTILEWRRAEHLDELRNSSTPAHQAFVKPLELYLNQDADTYNFGGMEKIFLFQYKGYTIGSTSPVTLFCPSAVNLSKLNIRRYADGSFAFGDNFLPLYKRTFDFQKWFYCLLAICREKFSEEVSENLKCIYDYAEMSINLVQNETSKGLLKKLTKDDFKKDYEILNVKGDSSPVDILGVDLYINHAKAVQESFKNSDFVIKSTKEDCPYSHLVLQNNSQNPFTQSDWNYIRGLSFQKSFEVPCHVDTGWSEPREMPGFPDTDSFYLTVSDFLEPYLIKTVYPINSAHFYDGGCKSDSYGYLLPLKKDFFNFFNIEDLTKEGSENPQLSIIPQSGGKVVEVTLKIPVKKGNITFKRIYKAGEQNQKPNPEKPDGGIILEAKFGTTIFPFIKAGDFADISYRIQLVDSDKNLKNTKYSLEFYAQDGTKNDHADYKQRFDKDSEQATSLYYKVDKEFDFMQFIVSAQNAKALIIPNWPKYKRGGTGFTFAVDFGTTNTYIAYKKNESSEPPCAFDISNAIAPLFDEKHDRTILNDAATSPITYLIDREFIPRKIGGKEKDNPFSFPQRTAIAHYKDTDPAEGLAALQESNIPFGYEKTVQKGNQIDTGFKWNTSKEKKKRDEVDKKVHAYFEQIVMLMQAKVLLENGKLDESKLTWFYPNSMGQQDKNNLRDKWEKYFKKCFFKNANIPSGKLIPNLESLAPFYAQKEGKAVKGGAVISIDIGGGTTDVAVFLEGVLKATTSFKFAGDVLFGGKPDKNGFLYKYAGEIEKELDKGQYTVPQTILDDLLVANKASDINAFLFSIENSIDFWAKGKNVPVGERSKYSYREKLASDGELKFLIFYFYVSLIYHISKILKKIGEPVKYLMFSGNGSKILKILGDKEDLTKYTRHIGKIFEDNVGLEKSEISLVENPKEATCNGGLEAVSSNIDISGDINAAETVKPLIYTCIENKEFDKLGHSYYKDNLKSIKANLVKFHENFFKLNANEDKRYNFTEFFGIDKDMVKHVLGNYEDLLELWLPDSIDSIKEYDTDEVYETPFFAPLKCIISELSKKIAEDHQRNQ